MTRVARLLSRFERSAAHEILSWCAAEFGSAAAISSSFQTQSVPLLHMVSRYAPDTTVLFVDTSYHFPETLAFRDELVARWNLKLRILRADSEESVALGPQPYMRDPDLCCSVNKVEPMRRVVTEYQAWISGIRRDQTQARAQAKCVETTPEGVIRIHPMLEWTGADVLRYINENALPSHPLTCQGYASIGCVPCTAPVAHGADERSGRWDGQKRECGLHTVLRDNRTLS